MSRSKKKYPVHSISKSESDKEYKTEIHKKERRLVRKKLKTGDYDVNFVTFKYNDWDSTRDGKRWFSIKTYLKRIGKRKTLQLLNK